MGYLALAIYVLTILGANWSLTHLGLCSGEGPCTIPVAPALYAPSGVLWVGLALFLRDVVQDRLGRRWAVLGILVGAGLSYLIASPALALASGTAFLLSEFADYFVYQPLRKQHRPAAVLASGVVGSVVDSTVFLWLAFGSLSFLAGQVVGKWEMSLLCAVLVWAWEAQKLTRQPMPPTPAGVAAGAPVT